MTPSTPARSSSVVAASRPQQCVFARADLRTPHRSPRLAVVGRRRARSRLITEKDPDKPSSVVLADPVSVADHAPAPQSTDADKGINKASVSCARRRRSDCGALRGDLDNIVMKALRKESASRYARRSLADDVQRHLLAQLVARRNTARYQMGRFIARHKIAAAAATVVDAGCWPARYIARSARGANERAARGRRRRGAQPVTAGVRNSTRSAAAGPQGTTNAGQTRAGISERLSAEATRMGLWGAG